MFIFTTDEDGVIQTLTLGPRARYEEMKQTNPDLQFLEDRDVTPTYDPKEIMQSPQSFRMISTIGLIKTS